MPIKQESFRIGCGRYLQRENLLDDCNKEFLRFGNKAFIVYDDTSFSIVGEKLEGILNKNQYKFVRYIHNGTCNEDDARVLADLLMQKACDFVVGVGGGVIMDFVKLVANDAKCAIVNIPTSSATCAAYTPLSVRYTREGKTVGSLHFDHEVDEVLVDTMVLKNQPVRLLLAGVFDAIAKFVEIKQRVSLDQAYGTYPLGLDYAYTLSEYSYKVLTENIMGCIEDRNLEHVSPRLDQVIFTTIAATGVISGIARGSNQSALGHFFYEGTRLLFNQEAKPFLHGEIVGVGLLLQNIYNGESNDGLLNLMHKYNMPASVKDIQVEQTKENFALYEKDMFERWEKFETDKSKMEKLHLAMEEFWKIQ